MRDLIDTVRQDHRDFRDVLGVLRSLVSDLPEVPRLSDTTRLSSILHYLKVYLDRYHHPKEDRLFAVLRRSEPRFDPQLREFESQHLRGAALLRDLNRALTRYEEEGAEGSRDALAEAARAYAAFHLAHMREEENILRSLTRREIDALDRVVVYLPRRHDRHALRQAQIEAGFVTLARHIIDPVR